jgi:hypothetical protein
MGDLAWLVIIAGTAAVVGIGVGILLIAPRLTRWAEREDDGDRDG